MTKKKHKALCAQSNGHFSPRALYQIKQKETELKLSSYSFCKKPYQMLDYSPFIYIDILKVLNKQFCRKYRPIKILESTITESSNYINSSNCMLFPVFVKGRMYLFIETNDYNKATYGLKIEEKQFFNIVESLKKFFSSEITNKRSVFPDFIKEVDGVMQFKRFSHTSSTIWEQRIKEFIQLFPSRY